MRRISKGEKRREGEGDGEMGKEVEAQGKVGELGRP